MRPAECEGVSVICPECRGEASRPLGMQNSAIKRQQSILSAISNEVSVRGDRPCCGSVRRRSIRSCPRGR